MGLDVAYYVVHERCATKYLSHRGVDTDRKAGFTRFILQNGATYYSSGGDQCLAEAAGRREL